MRSFYVSQSVSLTENQYKTAVLKLICTGFVDLPAKRPMKKMMTLILMLTSMAIVADNIRDKEFLGGRKWLRGLYYLMLAGTLALHLASNIYYFVTLCGGAGYWR